MRCLSAIAIAASIGCTTTLQETLRDIPPDTSALPPVAIDVEASEVLLTAPFNADDYYKGDLRRQLADALSERLNTGRGGQTVNARFKLVAEEKHGGGYTIVVPGFVFLVLFGCPIGWSDATAELTLQLGGRTYRAKHDASAWNFLYSPDTISGPQAIARAVAADLREIDAQVQQGGGT